MLAVIERFHVYPEIDPFKHFAEKSFKDKIILITGASHGIGKQYAITYAQAGASLVISACNVKALDDVKQEDLRVSPATENVSVVADVADVKQVETFVKAGVERFGKLDIVIGNARMFIDCDAPLGEQDPVARWAVFEVNLRSVHSLSYFTLPHLVKVEGYFVAISSLSGMMRVSNGSSYRVSKHAVNRFIEFVALEYPTIKAFAIHPGVIATDANAQTDFPPVHEMGLPTATTIYLTSGNADWLSGRFIFAPWDLGEVRDQWKEKIEKEAGLVSKLFIPAYLTTRLCGLDISLS
ncbi:hypothetical protein EWM64_g2672 [Hericium alpestre]|uniref:NAD(P)-binding protein n=1 Tax=Hericium alpestre TaxID=135208 RepID=A0A4Z0A4F4_9AGAM|nr:hypothetical protein EWM64_g2672 [Hericium alpestre]